MIVRPRDRWPLGAAGFVITVSVLWWGFALFAIPDAPAWLNRARAVCFNVTASGLPDAKGWLLLIGQPPAMLAALYAGWGADVRNTLSHLVTTRGGRFLLGCVVVVIIGGTGVAGLRVAALNPGSPGALAAGFGADFSASEPLPETYPRLNRPWPDPAGLVDQDGDPFTLASLNGRRAFATFAFGHCETICPLVVHTARRARLVLEPETAIVVFTLDPWRDTPGRLASMAEQFGLDAERDFVVGGSVDAVNAALDAFDVARQRNRLNGDIVHPALVYLVDEDGTLAYASTGEESHLVQLAARLD